MGRMIRQGIAALAAIACVPLLSGCGPTKEEMAEFKAKQQEVLARLEQMEKKIDQAVVKMEQAAARSAAPAPRPGPDANKVHQLPIGKSAIRGPADAPVTIVEFSDYQCPFCARNEPLIAEVLKQYPTQVKFVYKHFPLPMHQNAMGAAKAAVAAQKQGKFWEMHDKIFANMASLQPDKLRQFAQELGLDLARFDADMNSPETQSTVQEDLKLGQSVDVRGTPTVFVNGKLLAARSADGYKAAVEEALKQPKS